MIFKPKYIFSEEEILLLKEKWTINWCGWKWWFDFDCLLKTLIQQLESYLPEKSESLFKKVEMICYSHDYEFSLWGNYYHFIRANFRFAKDTFALLTWTKLYQRIILSLTVFLVLNLMWKKYFNYK